MEIWIQNPIGKDFRIDVSVPPRVGDLVAIGHKTFRVNEVLYRPLSMEYEKINECTYTVGFNEVPLEDQEIK